MSQDRQIETGSGPLDVSLRPRPEGAARPVVAFERLMGDGALIPWHEHDHDQLAYGASGLMRVESTAGAWIVPPARAVWIPAAIGHQITFVGDVAMQTLYVLPDAAPWLPTECCVMEVPPLLRELVRAAMAVAPGYAVDGPDGRLVAVLLDQLRVEPLAQLHLPLPRDRRLRAVTDALIADPADPRSLEDNASRAGASARTLARRFFAETGLTFGAWRQQLRLHEALARLSQGEPVTSVAFAVGYDSPSAFIAMFRKVLGDTPGRFMGNAG